MAKVLRFKEADLITEFSSRVEQRAFRKLSEEFNNNVWARFFQVKGNLEDWQDPLNETLLTDRLKVLAAKAVLTEDNLMDVALIATLLYNIQDE